MALFEELRLAMRVRTSPVPQNIRPAGTEGNLEALDRVGDRESQGSVEFIELNDGLERRARSEGLLTAIG